MAGLLVSGTAGAVAALESTATAVNGLEEPVSITWTFAAGATAAAASEEDDWPFSYAKNVNIFQSFQTVWK